MVAFVVTQLILIPILGSIWLGMRRETEQQRRLLVLAMTVVSRRKR
jgi:hypothetical protein